MSRKPRESSNPVATKEVRAAWHALPQHKLIDILSERIGTDGSVTTCNSASRHIKIIGAERTVELYATTGTVNCAPQGKLKSCNYKNMMPERAIERAITLAQKGW
jgi:hypothetical protein